MKLTSRAPLLAIVTALSLGLAGCVAEDDDGPPPAEDPTEDTSIDPIGDPTDGEEAPGGVDPAGPTLPDPAGGDGTCGGAPREKADGPCTP